MVSYYKEDFFSNAVMAVITWERMPCDKAKGFIYICKVKNSVV